MTEHARDNEQPTHDHVRAGDATLAAILTMVTRMDDKLDKHMDHEEEEIKGIKKAVDEKVDKLSERIDNYMQSVNSYMETQCDLTRAFVKSKDGEPDVDGHRSHHETLIEKDQRWKQRIEKWKDSVGEKVVWIVIAFVCLAVWEAIKQSAKQ